MPRGNSSALAPERIGIGMRDEHGREIDYIRLSVTDRCNLRCTYCMPEEGVAAFPHRDILTFEEIHRVVSAAASLGIRRVKITGGEPLVRKGVVHLIRSLRSIDGIAPITVTTNGILLSDYAAPLKEAGVDGVNVSLDSLDPDAYRRITRIGDVAEAVAGIDAAYDAGLPVKINCVPISGLNIGDVGKIAAMALDRNIQVRFIEMMPLGHAARMRGIPNSAVMAMLERAYGPLSPCPERLGNGPAEYYSLAGFAGRIGFISALGSCFCASCNRIRLTADGRLQSCLHLNRGVSLKPALAEESDGRLRAALESCVGRKPRRHSMETAAPEPVVRRAMSQIGG